MFFWMWRRGKDDKVRLVGIDLPPEVILGSLAVLGLLISLWLSDEVGPIVLLALGFALLLAAKVSVMRKGRVVTFGSHYQGRSGIRSYPWLE